MQGLVVFRPKNPTQDHVSVLRRGGFFVLIKVLRPAHEPGRAAASQDLLVTLAAHHLAVLGPAKHVPLALPAFLAFFHDASLMLRPRSPLATPSFSPRRNHSSSNYTLYREKMQLTAQRRRLTRRSLTTCPIQLTTGQRLMMQFQQNPFLLDKMAKMV